MPAKRKVFVVMPYSRDFDDLYHYGIERACAALKVSCVRVDKQIFTKGILNQIFDEIDSSDLVIGEMSVNNPNVYYEIGYATGRRKKLLLIARSAKEIPFDLKDVRHVIYGGSIEELEKALVTNIRALLDSSSDLGPRNISGRWVGTVWADQPNPKAPKSSINMDFRWAGRVEGLAKLRYQNIQVHLRFVGDFLHDRYLMMEYKGRDNAMMQFGSALLRLDGTGRSLEGFYLGYGAINDATVYGRVNMTKRRAKNSKSAR